LSIAILLLIIKEYSFEIFAIESNLRILGFNEISYFRLFSFQYCIKYHEIQKILIFKKYFSRMKNNYLKFFLLMNKYYCIQTESSPAIHNFQFIISVKVKIR
jgi:hypothetical protein